MIADNPDTGRDLLTAANVGHGVWQTPPPPAVDLHGLMLEHARNTELTRRGLRFLPAQAVKRALRTMLHNLKKADLPELSFVSNHKKLIEEN